MLFSFSSLFLLSFRFIIDGDGMMILYLLLDFDGNEIDDRVEYCLEDCLEDFFKIDFFEFDFFKRALEQLFLYQLGHICF